MRDRLDELIHPRPGDGGERGAAGREGGAEGGVGRGRPAPLDAAEDDPDATRVAALPGYSAGGAGDGDVAVGPPSQDQRG